MKKICPQPSEYCTVHVPKFEANSTSFVPTLESAVLNGLRRGASGNQGYFSCNPPCLEALWLQLRFSCSVSVFLRRFFCARLLRSPLLYTISVCVHRSEHVLPLKMVFLFIAWRSARGFAFFALVLLSVLRAAHASLSPAIVTVSRRGFGVRVRVPGSCNTQRGHACRQGHASGRWDGPFVEMERDRQDVYGTRDSNHAETPGGRSPA